MEDLRDFMKESESNVKKVLETIKDIRPCVFFIGQIEKMEALEKLPKTKDGGRTRHESKIKKIRSSRYCAPRK